MELSDEFIEIAYWLAQERKYQVDKFGILADDIHVREGAGGDSWLYQQVTNYLNRLRIFPQGSPQWMQAYMKLIATVVGLGEAAVRQYGLPPAPGFSSGEIKEWDRWQESFANVQWS